MREKHQEKNAQLIRKNENQKAANGITEFKLDRHIRRSAELEWYISWGRLRDAMWEHSLYVFSNLVSGGGQTVGSSCHLGLKATSGDIGRNSRIALLRLTLHQRIDTGGFK